MKHLTSPRKRAEIVDTPTDGFDNRRYRGEPLPEKQEDLRDALLNKRAITPRQFEEIYGIPRGSQANMRWAKKGPKYYKAGPRRVIYMVKDVEEWLCRNPVITLDSWEEEK